MKSSLSDIDWVLNTNNKLRLSIAFFGVCISVFSILAEGLINRDGVLYLQTAQVFDEAGFSASAKVYRWPFYSIAIAWIHSLTSLSYENSAHLLNTLFLLILVDAFVRLYWELHSNVKYWWMPAVVILAYTGLNDYRPMIIRDWGYWAFLFQALLYFIKAYKYEQLKAYILWQIAIVLAFLFRIEALVFMMLLPFVFLIKKKSIGSFIHSGFLLLIPFSIVLSLMLTGYKGGRLTEIFSYLDVGSYWDVFVKYAYSVAKIALRHHAEDNAVLFVSSGLLSVLIVKTIKKIGLGYLAIMVTGWFRYKNIKEFNFSFVNWMIAISFLVFIVYFFRSKVIAGRYTIQITLFFLLYVTYYSELIFEELRLLERPVLLALFGGGFFINLVVGIQHSASNKLYIKTMGEWVENNIADSARVTTNDARLYYYSGGILKKNMIKRYRLKNNDYALLKIKDGNKQYDKLINKGRLELVHSVEGRSKDKAVLFKIQNP